MEQTDNYSFLQTFKKGIVVFGNSDEFMRWLTRLQNPHSTNKEIDTLLERIMQGYCL